MSLKTLSFTSTLEVAVDIPMECTLPNATGKPGAFLIEGALFQKSKLELDS